MEWMEWNGMDMDGIDGMEWDDDDDGGGGMNGMK